MRRPLVCRRRREDERDGPRQDLKPFPILRIWRAHRIGRNRRIWPGPYGSGHKQLCDVFEWNARAGQSTMTQPLGFHFVDQLAQ